MGGMVLVPLTEVWHFTGVIDWQSLAAYLVVVILGTVCSFGLYLSSARYLSAVEMTVIAAVEHFLLWCWLLCSLDRHLVLWNWPELY